MKDTIQKELAQIEQTQNVRILLAVESGSRAWGFASPDSDYDVRFIYVRPKDAYLRLQKHRDVIELPINDALDINGWDLTKTLRLLHKSNPTLFEWGASPIVYLETDFAARFKSVMGRYFSSKRGLYHYIHMAAGNYREYIKGDMIKAKKYFYVLRPVLACFLILLILSAASIVGTATRMISHPAFSSLKICATHASTSSVFVFVIDWIAIFSPPPMHTSPICTFLVLFL